MLKNILLLLLVTSLAACNPFERTGPEAIYIQVEALELETFNNSELGNQGANSSNFPDAWIYVNGRNMGMYEMPTNAPLIYNGPFRLGISAGIRVNGISNTRAEYPFMQIWEKEITNLEPGSTINITELLNGENPKVRYQEGVQFFIRDFEDPNNRLELITPGDTAMVIVDNTFNLSYLQNKVAAVYLTPEKPRMYLATPNDSRLPAGGRIFLELDYNTPLDITINLISLFANGQQQSEFVSGVRPTFKNGERVWNKVYIDLSDIVGRYGTAIRHSIFFEAANFTTEEQVIFLDNVKIIHF